MFHRLRQENHRAEIRGEISCSEIDTGTTSGGVIDDQRDTGTSDQLHDRHAACLGRQQLHEQGSIAFIHFMETVAFVFLAAKHLDDALTLHDFLGHMRDIAHRTLDTR